MIFYLDEMRSNGVSNAVSNGRMSDHQVESNLSVDEDILHETRSEKILTTTGTILLLMSLAFLWIYYR